MGEITFEKAVSFEEFLNKLKFKIENSNILNIDEKTLNYLKLNLQRMERILKYEKSESEIDDIISQIKDKTYLAVITEDWCGDSAQSFPYFYLYAEKNKNIEIKILYRDENLDIMDKYLTNGTRSIPIIIAFDQNMKELAKWGPRPKALMNYFQELKLQNMSKEELIEKIHLWYGKDKGKEIKKEAKEFFLKLVK